MYLNVFQTTVKESYLLEKIVKEDGLNTLIVNLYHGSEGYSLMLRDCIGKEIETTKLPYEASWDFKAVFKTILALISHLSQLMHCINSALHFAT